MPRAISRNRRNKDRKKNANESLLFLSNIIDEGNSMRPIVSDSVAKSILRLGKKHGFRTNNIVNQKICRTCQKYLNPGISSRIRISNGFILNTCITCHRTYRIRLDKE
jgi:ribonuclease P protein subunit RPR2